MKKDVLWGYLSQFLQYGAALLVLPLLLRKLTSAELGIWFVFMTISALVTILDTGFTPTVARNVSYVMGGAKRLLTEGFEVVKQADVIDYGLLKAIIVASQKIFLWIAVAALVLLAVPGTVYILNVSRDQVDQRIVISAWCVFTVATVLNLFFKYYTPLLQGRGLYAEFYKSSALANIVFVAVSAALLQADLGLLAVALGYLMSALVGRWLSWHYFYDAAFKARLEQAPLAGIGTAKIFRILWHNAWRLGLGVIGAFLILRSSTLLSSVYLGLATTAAYALTLQIFSMLISVSTVAFNVQLPKLAKYRVTNDRRALLQTIEQGLGYSLGLFVVGTVILLCVGPSLIQSIGGNTDLLPVHLSAWMGLMMLLELNHSLAASIIITGNQVPFVKAALLSGAAIVTLSWIGLEYGGFGISWVIGCQFVVQVFYNNWQWPWRVYREFYFSK